MFNVNTVNKEILPTRRETHSMYCRQFVERKSLKETAPIVVNAKLVQNYPSPLPTAEECYVLRLNKR